MFYEQKFGWLLEISPQERRRRAIEHYDAIMKWPEEDRELYAIIADDDFEAVSKGLRPLVDRLLQIMDARAALHRIAVLNLDEPARADHALRQQRAAQQFRVREAHEAAAFKARTERIAAGESADMEQDGACCPLLALKEKAL